MKIKKWLCGLAAGAVLCLSLSACSTPRVAVTVDGTDYTTGVYLAFLYNSFYNMYYNNTNYQYPLYYYEQQGTDVWSIPFTYGLNSDTQVILMLSQYIQRDAVDTMVRTHVLQQMIAQYNLPPRADDQASIATQLASAKDSQFMPMGFNTASYATLINALSTDNQAFYGLYGPGGPREVPDSDLLDYFNTNYISYKIIQLSLLDPNASPAAMLTGDALTAVTDQMNGYLEMYKKTGDFDAVITQFNADQQAAEDAAAAADAATGTDASGNTTTAAPTTTTTTDTTTAPTDTTTTTSADGSTDTGDTTDTTPAADPNRVDVDAKANQSATTDAVQTVSVGDVQIVKFNQNATEGVDADTIALIQRLDPHTKIDVTGDVFDTAKDDILQAMKYDEFNTEIVQDVINLWQTGKVIVSNRAVDMSDPQKFVNINANS